MKEQAGGDNSHRKEVASSASGQKTRPSADANFGEYEDNEWDVGIGNLIDDLDADIEKSSSASDVNQTEGMPATGLSGATRGTKLPISTSASAPVTTPSSVQHCATVDKGLKMKIKRTKPTGGSKSAEKHEIVKAVDPDQANGKPPSQQPQNRKEKDGVKEQNSDVTVKTENTDFAAPNAATWCNSKQPSPPSLSCSSTGPTPKKKPKLEQDGEVDGSSGDSVMDVKTTTEKTDACVGTSVGTVTEPDCLGPCEPGTSVTLEGIVWQETDTGLLVVNVTWRGKTYVGTLLDCTRHDWAPPRFCESPTSDLEIRTPKGRGKRGRGSNCTPVNEVISAPETRSSTQNKLRSGKGRRGAGATTFAMPPSPAKQDNAGAKRKGRQNDTNNGCSVNGTSAPGGESPSGKKSRSSSSRSTPTPVASATIVVEPPGSPTLIECPEPNCGKKYKHINGLKYHQSHAHADSVRSSSPTVGNGDGVAKAEPGTGSMSENETENDEASDVAVPEIKTEPVDPIDPGVAADGSPLVTPKQEPMDTDSSEMGKSTVMRYEDSSGGAPGVQAPATSTGSSAPPASTPVSAKAGDSVEEPVVYQQQQQRPGPKPAVRVPAANADKLRTLTNAKPALSATPPSTTAGVGANKPNGPLGLTATSSGALGTVQQQQQGLRPVMVDSASSGASSPAAGPELDNLRRERIKSRKRTKDGKPTSSSPRPPSATPSPPGPAAEPCLPKAEPSPLGDGNAQASSVPTLTSSVLASAPLRALSPIPPPMAEGNSTRDEVTSPAYSDISDPNDSGANDSQLDVTTGKPKSLVDAPKSPSSGDVVSSPQGLPSGYPGYPFYGAQLPYPVSSVATLHRQPPMSVSSPGRPKDSQPSPSMGPRKDEPEKDDGKGKGQPDGSKVMPSPVYPYGYNYPYSPLDPNYLRLVGSDPAYKQFLQDQERAVAESDKSHQQAQRAFPGTQPPKPGHPSDLSKPGPSPGPNPGLKDGKSDHGKDGSGKATSVDKPQFAPSRPSSVDDKRDVYGSGPVAPMARHGGPSVGANQNASVPPKSGASSSPKTVSNKDSAKEQKKDGDKKPSGGEGVKPTMETHGPPPPTATGAPSSYYLHPGYLGSPHYRPGHPGFDPNAALYQRLAPGVMGHWSPFPAYPPGMPRFLEPGAPGPDAQDLSGKSNKALDMLRHHVSLYPGAPPVTMSGAPHKIHELQDQGKPGTSSGSGSSGGKPSDGGSEPPMAAIPQPSSPAIGIAEAAGVSSAVSTATSRSPPAQHHVHTHHHTHVGLGFPLPVAPQFPGAYPGAVLAPPQPAVIPPSAYGASPNK